MGMQLTFSRRPKRRAAPSGRQSARRSGTNDLLRMLTEVPLEASAAPDTLEALRVSARRTCDLLGWSRADAFEVDANGGLAPVAWPEDAAEPAPAPNVAVHPPEPSPACREAARQGSPAFLPQDVAIPVCIQGRVYAVLGFRTPSPRPLERGLKEVLSSVSHHLGTIVTRMAQSEHLEELRAQLDARDLDRVRLLGTTAHEIGNPLAVLSLHLELLGAKVGPAAAPSMEVVRRNIDRLKCLAGDLQDAARLETAAMHLEPVGFDLAGEARRAVRNQAETAAAAGVTVDSRLEPARVHADIKRIGQVMDNLLSNALKFTPEGGVVQVDTGVEGDAAWLVVKNEGPVLPASDISRLFHPYVQLPEGARRGGTGLGLYISHRIAQQSGGDLVARALPDGRGMAFELRLPALGAPRCEPPEAQPFGPAGAAAGGPA